ncbi:YidC/Oxa1 family membrane protein insertase [Patescibacteria group bacterium]|nr:YidC/Oxa1 family membrane protein insertase [Patescibacteria group bacterium]
MLIEIYNTVLYEPIFNLLVFFYNIVPGHDLGLAIILFTILIKLILSPFFVQSIKAQRSMQSIQPKIDDLKEKYKGDKEKMGPAMMELYKKEKVNPFSSCLPLLIQMPILIAVFQVFRKGLVNGSFELVYPFIANPGSMDPIAFGIIDLSQKSIVLAVLAGAAQFWQSRMMMAKRKNQPAPKSAMASAMGKQMMYILPFITVYFGSQFPAGLTFYWFLTTLLGALQQLIVFKKMDKQELNLRTKD